MIVYDETTSTMSFVLEAGKTWTLTVRPSVAHALLERFFVRNWTMSKVYKYANKLSVV